MKTYPKVAFDLYIVQMVWTAFFLGITFAIHIFQLIGAAFWGDGEVDYFYNSSFVASNIYMLVLGIIAITFLSYYVENGVTRKDYYKGTLLASIGLSLTIPVLTIILSFLERILFSSLLNITFRDANLNSVMAELDNGNIGDLIAGVIQQIILTPFIDPAHNWFFSLALFSLNIFTYYLFGWLISSAFHHSGVITGLALIILSLVLLTIQDTFLRMALDFPVLYHLPLIDSIPLSVALIIIFFIILVAAWLVYRFTKRVRIKM
jgi:hypothetical protein